MRPCHDSFPMLCLFACLVLQKNHIFFEESLAFFSPADSLKHGADISYNYSFPKQLCQHKMKEFLKKQGRA